MEKYTALKERAKKYTDVLQQVVDFREAWGSSLKQEILDTIDKVLAQTGISANIEIEERFEHLESITVSLGKNISAISEKIADNTSRPIVKDMGAMVYSQLFNGKVQCWMTYPLIEGLMQPKQPKMIGIYAPAEFNEELILGNFDSFFKELIEWENYDDDQPGAEATTRIGFGMADTDLDD